MESAMEYLVNCSCFSKRARFPDPYTFSFDGTASSPPEGHLFESNEIRTSKYTLFTFLPKALMLQFKRLANVYFLVISILMSIAVISPINPLTAWAPLIIVIGISMMRQGYEDYQRYASDQRLNHEQKTTVVRRGEAVVVEWSQVQVGDVCFVESEEMFPADLILLASANEGSVAYIETASLDGEKNLKPRNAYPSTSEFNANEAFLAFRGIFEGDLPNKDLHKFQARISIPSSTVTISGDKQLLYRGTKLKNTRWIYGLVAYTGKNTKIILNSESQSVKMSQIEIKVNYVLGIILLIQVALCLICAVLYGIYRQKYQEEDTYIDWPGYGVSLDGFIQFLTYFVLLNTMIPISLVVSMEVVKMFQKYFIQKDQLMFSTYRNRYVSVQSASLNEQLGQIEYVFSDKTGTLTMNVMQFKIAVIGSHLFGDLNLISGKDGDSRPKFKGFRDDGLKKMLTNGSGDGGLYNEIVVRNREGDDQIVFKRKRELAEEYFLLLGLAHEVITQTNKKGQVVYQGPSPDQIALVDAAKSMDYEFLRASQAQTFIKVRGREKKFELLQSFPFTSDRKRMSIIIRDPRDNRIKMFTKGADSIIKGRLSPHQKLNLDNELTQFSNIGLRTLLVAMRIISEKEYGNFVTAVERIPQARRQAQKEELINELQTNLFLIGATAVLDRLQDDVAETIRDMIRANIKVWMLTGDKMETAENIAKSCKLIQPGFEIMRLKLQGRLPNVGRKDSVKVKEQLQDSVKDVVLSQLKKLVEQADNLEGDGVQKALMVEGSDLTYVLMDDDCKRELANLAKTCEAVICCRLLPIQKAEVVQVVRQYLNKITLAIGDGANDVPMIKTAHIGIGLYGEQGMGAVQASDYALPEFRMLWRLLFVHGRWNYIRISQMILYFFYKNMLFTLPQFITAFYCGFSGQTIFDDIYITLYNLVFTAIPLLIRAIFEQDVNYVYRRQENDQNLQPQLTGKSLIAQQSYLPDRYGINKYFYRLFPKIYFIGQQNCIFNYKNYFMWMFEGVIQAVLITLFCFYILGAQSLRSSGISSDFWLVGLTIYSAIIMVVTFKLATHTRFWSFCLFFSICVTSIGMYAAYTWISNYALSPVIEGTAHVGWTTVETYLVVLFTICLVLFIDGVIVFVDFRRGSYASKMREVINNEQINNRYFYDEISLFITEGLTEQEKR